jgi:hypothetical protein
MQMSDSRAKALGRFLRKIETTPGAPKPLIDEAEGWRSYLDQSVALKK